MLSSVVCILFFGTPEELWDATKARLRYLEGLPLLYSTTFVFEMPLDLYSFQLCVSPEGLSNIKRLIIAHGKSDWTGVGPFFSVDTPHPHGSLDEWGKSVHGLKQMAGLYQVQVWLGHRQVRMAEWERRPWKEDLANQMLEQRHQKLIDLFSSLDMPNFTIHLTWNPQDFLSQRTWPFEIKLHETDKMRDYIAEELPSITVPDIFNW